MHSKPCADDAVTKSCLISVDCQSSVIIASSVQIEHMVVPHCGVGWWKHDDGRQTATSPFQLIT